MSGVHVYMHIYALEGEEEMSLILLNYGATVRLS